MKDLQHWEGSGGWGGGGRGESIIVIPELGLLAVTYTWISLLGV